MVTCARFFCIYSILCRTFHGLAGIPYLTPSEKYKWLLNAPCPSSNLTLSPKNVIGKIYSRFETNGLKIIAARMAHLSRAEAEGFYAVHNGRPFFNDLVEFMTSGPVMIQALEGENAIAKNRELMGATDPKKAEAGTIRADFAASIDANAVHGSDAAGNRRRRNRLFLPRQPDLFPLSRCFEPRQSARFRSARPRRFL